MIITGSNEISEKDRERKSSPEKNEMSRTFICMRNSLREDLKDIKNIQW